MNGLANASNDLGRAASMSAVAVAEAGHLAAAARTGLRALPIRSRYSV